MSFGQYSRDRVGHLRLGDQVPAAAVKYARAGHNRIVWEDADGVRYFRLIHSDIVIFDPKTAVYTVDYSGFHTKTTSQGIGEALKRFMPDYDGYAGMTYPKRKTSKRHTLKLWELGPEEAGAALGYSYRPRIRDLPTVEFDEMVKFRLTPNGSFTLLEVDGQQP